MGKAKARAKHKADKLAQLEHEAHKPVTALAGTPAVKALGGASEAADQPPLIALGAATLALGALLRRPVMARTGARMLASHLVATGIKTVLKRGIDRTRPSKAAKDGHSLGSGRGSGDSAHNSFPSGHTAGAVAVAEAIAHAAPAGGTPARLAAGAVAALQPARGAHYGSDVLVGAAIGWLSERIAGAALDWGERRVGRALAVRGQAAAEEESAAHPS